MTVVIHSVCAMSSLTDALAEAQPIFEELELIDTGIGLVMKLHRIVRLMHE